jgi:hypothetical protein
MTECILLPNALHIDAVIANMSSSFSASGVNYQHARETLDKTSESMALRMDMTLRTVNYLIPDAPRIAAWIVTKTQVWDVAWPVISNTLTAAQHAVWSAARDAAWNAVLALIAYDHCARYLTMTADQLQIWSALSDDPAAILLVPYVTFLEEIQTITTDLVL